MADFGSFFATHAHRLQQAPLYWPQPQPASLNPAWPAARFRALIVRLSPFRDVDRSTPHLFLADAVRRAAPTAFVDFAFFPPPRDRALLRENAVPWLTGIFSQRSAEDFDVVLISNAYTLELLNLPALLLGSGIPPWARDRAGRWPPFILGGSNALASQAILDANGGSFVDAIFFGEGEEQVEKLIARLSAQAGAAKPCRKNSPQGFAVATHHEPSLSAVTDRRYSNPPEGGASSPASPTQPCNAAGLETPPTKNGDGIADWAKNIPGLWLTGRWPAQPVPKAVLKNPAVGLLPLRVPALNGPEAGAARLQINYGCPAFCTFCFEGYDRKPYRELPAVDLLAAARELKRVSGAEALEVFSFNFNTHGELLQLLPELNRIFDRVNLMSQRVDLLAQSPDLLAAELAGGKRSFTLGIEGISERLRAMLHKTLTTDDIRHVLQRLLREKIRELKFFYLLTGDETADDMAEFAAFCRELHDLRRMAQPGLRVMFSFGLLIRMPFTPLRHDRLRLDETAWQPLLRAARGAVTNAGFEFRLAMSWPEYAVTQMLALAPAGLAPALLEFAQTGGCYDQTLPAEAEQRLLTWMQQHGFWTEPWLAEKPVDYPFAFDFVRSNVTPKFLFTQFQASRRNADGGFCLGGECLACGACTSAAERKRQTGHKLQTPADRDWLKKFTALMTAKARLRPVFGRLRLAPGLAGAAPEWLNAHVMRALLAALPAQAGNLLSVRESLFTAGENAARWPVFSGETVFALKAWDAEALLAGLAKTSTGGGNIRVGGSSSSREIEPSSSNTRELELPPTSVLMPGPAPAIRWLGQVFPRLGKDNVPVFQALEIELRLPADFFPDAENVFQRWLKAHHCAFGLRRTARGLSLQLDPRKKSFLSRAELGRPDGETVFQLRAGPTFDLADFIAAFGDANLARRADVRVVRVDLQG